MITKLIIDSILIALSFVWTAPEQTQVVTLGPTVDMQWPSFEAILPAEGQMVVVEKTKVAYHIVVKEALPYALSSHCGVLYAEVRGKFLLLSKVLANDRGLLSLRDFLPY